MLETNIETPVKSKVGIMLAVVVACLWFCRGASAETITFATYPGGTQVPASDVSTATTFSPTSVMGDQFAALGIHFSDTGLLTEDTSHSDGGSTHADGWCSSGGYTCSPNNILLENSPSGEQSLDTLSITFDIPQTDVKMDIFNGYLAESPAVSVKLSGGTLPTPTTLLLTQASEIAACSASQSAFALCGRFDLGVAANTFTEVDVLPTTAFGAPSACTGTGPNCGGSLVDNISFTATAPEPSYLALLGIGMGAVLSSRRFRRKI